jgi:Uma2 family endonuclease
MVLPVKVYDAEGKEFSGPYLVYMDGWTEERYLAEAPEMGFVEFADGELIVHSPVSIRHQEIAGFLTFLLTGYVDSNGLGTVLNGPAVVRLRPDLLYEPDVFFVSRDRSQTMEAQYYSGAPSLVVEVLSPSTRSYDLRVKAANYREHGVLEYWAIDAVNSRLRQHVLGSPDAAYTLNQHFSGRVDSEALPGFWIDAGWLWSDPLPGSMECLGRVLQS